MGLLTHAPVHLCGDLGTSLLFRRGRRWEATLIGVVFVTYVAWNSGLSGPQSFGTFGPGPRYLIPMLPFLPVPLGVSFRAFPLATTVLALVSSVLIVTITATHPLAPFDDRYFHRLPTRHSLPSAPPGA